MFLLVFLIVLILALGGGGYAVPNLRVIFLVMLIVGWPMRWYY
jgi:hypothetical protein